MTLTKKQASAMRRRARRHAWKARDFIAAGAAYERSWHSRRTPEFRAKFGQLLSAQLDRYASLAGYHAGRCMALRLEVSL